MNALPTIRILTALAESGSAMATPELLAPAGEIAMSRQRALKKCWDVLRQHERVGHVARTGTVPWGWKNIPAVTWRITDAGHAWLDQQQESAREHRDISFGDIGSISITLNVRWLALSDDQFVGLRKVIKEIEALGGSVLQGTRA